MLLGTIFNLGALLGESAGLKNMPASGRISTSHWLEEVFAKPQNQELKPTHFGRIKLPCRQGRRA